MRNYNFDKKFTDGFVITESGGGSTIVESNVLTVRGKETQAAARRLYVPLRGGSVVEVECSVKVIKGSGRLSIDTLEQTTTALGNYTETSSNEWTRIKTTLVIPLGIGINAVSIVFGKWGSQNEETEIQYRDPEIRIMNGFGQEGVVAKGLILCNKGEFSLRDTYAGFGVTDISLDSTKTILTVKLDGHLIKSGFYKSLPTIMVSGTSDNVLIPNAGGYDGEANSFKVRFSNGTKFVDISGEILYFFFKVTV